MYSNGKRRILVFVFLFVTTWAAEGFTVDLGDLLFHSGITESGHTGLLLTKGGTSIAPGKYFIGLTPNYFDRDLSGGKSESKLTIPLTITYGLPNNLELAGKVPYVSRDNENSDSGISDLGLSIKWSFLQEEGKSYPSLATGVSGRIAVADMNKGLTDIDDYGLTIFLSGTALIDLPYRDYAFALYGEGSAIMNDLGGNAEEKHGAYDVGIMLPIPSVSGLGFILEFGGTISRGIKSNEDFIRFTPALRLNYRSASFTLGASIINPEISGEDTYVNYILSAVWGF